MKLKFSKHDVDDWILFGMEIYLCVTEQYPELIKRGEMITVKEL